MHQKQAPALPSHSSAVKQTEKFSEYFVSKIVKIRDQIDRQLQNETLSPNHGSILFEHLSEFPHATEKEIKEIISASKNSSCQLDPIPTHLLKECSESFIPAICNIINMSLSSGSVPSCMKQAVIRPLLKKKHLDHENFKNYRPVSNLPFISKVLEKIVAKRLLKHMEINNLHEVMQSAYKQLHSTETALIRVQNDILTEIDRKRGVILVLLDLSAAFDTIDHNILFYQLQHRLGISETALQWFKSYLSSRTQSVSIENVCSKESVLQCNWCPARFSARSASIHHLHFTPRRHFKECKYILPFICG